MNYTVIEDKKDMCWRIQGPSPVHEWYLTRLGAENAAKAFEQAYHAGAIGARANRDISPTVVAAVSAAYSAHISVVRAEDVNSTARLKHLVRARHLAAYIMHQVAGMTLVAIGGVMGRNHATIIHSVNEACDLLRKDGDYRKALAAALQTLGMESLPLSQRGTGIA